MRTFGPLIPWVNAQPGLAQWDSAKDDWELYNLKEDFSQANNLAAKNPVKLAELQKLSLDQAKVNKVFPLGAGIWLRLHPEDVKTSPYTSWVLDSTSVRMPEFAAPGLGKKSNTVTIDVEVGENAGGVLYALGGSGGGLTCYLEDGHLVYEYNLMIIERYIVRSTDKIAPGRRTIVVDTTIGKPGAPADVIMTVDGREVGRISTKRTVPAAFSASETLDVGVDLGSIVSRDYYDRRPFAYNGEIHQVKIELK